MVSAGAGVTKGSRVDPLGIWGGVPTTKIGVRAVDDAWPRLEASQTCTEDPPR